MSNSKREIKQVSVARGAVLVVAMRWTDRLIGIASTLILARFLLPEDFGIVAMASIVVGLIDTLLDLGVGSALIQNKYAAREEFDTAWTLRLIQAVFAALFIWLSAPFAAEYFRDQRIFDVIRVMALAILIGGFENIGIVAFQKNMEFGRDFQFFFFRRIAGFVVTIALALWLHSYWAMVIGAVVGRTVGVVISYWLHDYRPRFSMARFRQIWSFSQWILVRNLGSYGAGQIDKLLVGRRTDAATMGSYALADEIAAMPVTELLAPLNRVLFPVLVNAANDPEKIRGVFCKAIGVQSIVALPAGVGLYMVADDVVLLLLGQRWQQAIPVVQILALMSVLLPLASAGSQLLLALGKVSLQAVLSWAQFALLVFMGIVVFPETGAQGIATIRLATSFLVFIAYLALVLRYVDSVRLSDLVMHTWRPILSTGIMALALAVVARVDTFALFAQVIFSIGIGAGVYACSILLLWRISGCSDCAESYLLERVGIKDRLLKWTLD